MLIEALKQEIAIECQEDARDLVDRQPGYWHVLSIYGRSTEQSVPRFQSALNLEQMRFDDVLQDNPERSLLAARVVHLEKAVQFSRMVGSAPLLIHCHAGTSRSTAIAWILVYDKLRDTLNAVAKSYTIVKRLRPCLSPNPHVLRLGVEYLFSEPKQQERVFRQFSAFLPRAA